ncbi:MAG: type IX secretion system sortase PorU, partial [Rhodothermales bacterium]|nr:type IX secretion system sortase PorU [Rhodothermales bacterium]
SDDYFGLLDDNEGEWEYRGFGFTSSERMDIGVGRFPVHNVQEAQLLLDKIVAYESPDTYGPWRGSYTFIADDAFTGATGNRPESDLHLQNIDSVAELVRQQLYPTLNARKIYGESYERVFLNEYRIPDAKRDILSSIENGTLIVNYSGHGGPSGLAQEEIFTKEDAAALTNGDKLPVFITATCSFGWWDIDDFESGAETLLLNPNGGAVAMLTTVRLVYTSSDTSSLNPGLNRALNTELFRSDAAGLPVRLGDAMVGTKNTSVGLLGNSRKFNLLGDPSMRLGIPAREAVVDRLNGVDVSTSVGALPALERVTVEGAVRMPGGSVDESFDGRVDVSVFDAEREVPIQFRAFMPTPYYLVREDLIWRGSVRAENGRFQATFVVPKDISYSNRAGRIFTYATAADGHAMGFTENVIVGGTSTNPPDDAVGPQISLFLNDTTFVSGSLTHPDPSLIVKLYDESGINTVGAGVGHELLLVVNEDEGAAIDISSAFEADENSYQRGTVEWALTSLDAGPGTVSVRAWDVLNNSASESLEFFVAETEDLVIRNVYNYPNPTSG